MSNRREFLKLTGLAGASIITGCATANISTSNTDQGARKRNYTQKFNMSGYAAPALDTVRIGFIGLGNRGPGAVVRMSKIQGVEIKGLCDIRPEKAEAARMSIEKTPH